MLARKFGGLWARMPWPDNDDPIDDFSRLVSMAAQNARAQGIEIAPDVQSDKSLPFVDSLSKRAAQMLPGFWPEKKWKVLLQAVLSARCGGTRPRIKKLPGMEKRTDAKRLTTSQMMEKHGISKSYAYKLLAKKKKRTILP